MKTKRGERKYLDGIGAEMPNIGEMLRQYFEEKRTYQAALARAIGRDPQTLHKYKRNHSLQAAIIWELSHALKYNFFADLAAALPVEFDKAGIAEARHNQEEMQALRAEIARLQQDKDLLMQMLKEKDS